MKFETSPSQHAATLWQGRARCYIEPLNDEHMAAVSVAELLNAAQESAAACERCAGGLWKLILQDPDSNFEELTTCVNLLLTVSQVSLHCACSSAIKSTPTNCTNCSSCHAALLLAL